MHVAKLVWGQHSIPKDKQRAWALGDLSVFLKSVDGEVWIAHVYGNDVESDKSASGLTWTRWAVKKEMESIQLVPAFPDRAVVVKTERPLRLQAGAQVRVLVNIPLWVVIKSSSKDGAILTEVPSVIHFSTWFGSSTEGELCYFLWSSFSRQLTAEADYSHCAICPLQIKNASSAELLVKQICLRVKWLSLYEYQGRLWSSEMKISFRGLNDASQVSIVGGPPLETPSGEVINTSREFPKRGLFIPTFSELS